MRTLLAGIGLVVVLAVVGSFVAYGSPPWSQPEHIDWCGQEWTRDGSERIAAPDGVQLYEVARRPPVIGTPFYSAASPAERESLGRCGGGDLFTRDVSDLIPYRAPVIR